jgi:predicted DCC family thiol-disulfide oxidoreductase YuxK
MNDAACLADGTQVLMRSNVASHVMNALRGAWQPMVLARSPPKRSRNALYGEPAPNGYRRFHRRTVHSVSR